MQVQESNPLPSNEVINVSSSYLRESQGYTNLDLPIAIKEVTRSYTQHSLSNFVTFNSFSPSHRAFLTQLNTITIPQTLFEALRDGNWKQAMRIETEALEKNGTWEIVELPRGKKPIGCKWMFTVKYKVDGSLERYKARLVAKGYTQTYGI